MSRPFHIENGLASCWTLSLLTFVFLAIFQAQPLLAQKPLEVDFNLYSIPSSRQALKMLASPATATFDKRPLGECLNSLSASYRVAIWVDRRVDLSRLVTIIRIGANEPLEAKTILARFVAIAKLGGVDAGLIENIVYIGPSEQVGAVQRAAVRLHNEIMTQRKSLPGGAQIEQRKLDWEELTTPSELLDSIRKRWNTKVDSTLPHDLMHAGELPESTLATQLTLLHAGFNMQVECERIGNFKASPLVLDSKWKAEYTDNELQSNRLPAARKEFPNATAQARGKQTIVIGPTGFHLRLLATSVSAQRVGTEDVFTIPTTKPAPLERVIGDLAKHLSLEVEWSDDIPKSKRATIVTFSVPKAKTISEILKQVADENGLKIQRQQQKIQVLP